MIDVFEAGKDGFGSYRVPVLLKLQDGTLLAFCEGRQFLSDHAENSIVQRRSIDNGATWSEISIVADAGKNALNNPLVVQDAASGDVILMYLEYPFTTPDEVDNPEQWVSHAGQQFPANFHEAAVVEGYDGKVLRSFVQRSTDGGRRWCEREEITRSVKRPTTVTCYAGGPGIGIQLAGERYKNRIVMPFSQGPWGETKVYAVISDDHGATWRRGAVAPAAEGEQASEVQMAELDNGDILLNARSFGGNKRRKIAISADGGETWSAIRDAADLIEPECHGSLIPFRIDGEDTHLIYCGPRDEHERRCGTLMCSNDDGRAWQAVEVVYDGSFGYSALCQLGEEGVAVLFEQDNYAKISFLSMNIPK